MNILDNPGLKTSPIIIDIQKDIADIKAHLKLTHEVIDFLDRAKVDHVSLKGQKGTDQKNRDMLNSFRLKLQKSLETLLKIGINPKASGG